MANAKQEQVVAVEESREEAPKRGCCFQGIPVAKGLAINGIGRGALIMSNIYLATSFMYLANQQAGCLDEDNKVIEDCEGRVYGMAPASVVSNLAVVIGVLSAFFMPIIGAIVDFTNHRKLMGVVATVLMVVVQGVQVGTVASTWFVMVILQAVSGFLYQVEVLSIYAYLPELGRLVKETVVVQFHSGFTALQFTSQIIFLVVIVLLQNVLQSDDVYTAQYSQGINTVWSIVCFAISWSLIPRVPCQRSLAEGKRLWIEGFLQVGRTTRKIYKDHAGTLGLFYPAVVFAESCANAFTTISVIFLANHIGWGAADIGIFFICAMLGVIPGTLIGGYVTKLVNPKNSWRIALSILVAGTVAGAFLLDRDSPKIWVYGWGFVIGITLGWHYPTEGVIYTLCLPKGQDAEFSGFYIYCTQILVWLPPLIFSGLVQNGISQKFGVFMVAMFAVVAIIIISMFPPWEEMVATFNKELSNEDEEVGDLKKEDTLNDDKDTGTVKDLSITNKESDDKDPLYLSSSDEDGNAQVKYYEF